MNTTAEVLGVVTITLSGVFFLCWLVWLMVEGAGRRAQIRAMSDFHNRLLDKVDSTEAFAQFLQSEEGRRFLDSVSVIERRDPQSRIMRSLQAGVIASFVAIAFIILGRLYPYNGDGFMIFGVLLLALGLGFLGAALVSLYFARHSGMLQQPVSRRNNPTSVL